MSSTTAAPALFRRRPLLAALPAWWHLLSLDAPTVAALWSWSLARALGVRLPLTAPLLLATGTWLIYVADRLLDGLRPELHFKESHLKEPHFKESHLKELHLEERHRFCRRHRPAFVAAAVPAAGLLLWLIAFHMSPAARRDDTALFACALAYFAAVHLPGRRLWRLPAAPDFSQKAFPKELAVAVLFALATAVPAWVRVPHGPGTAALAAGATLLFAALCWLNCAGIEKWEQPPAAVRRQGEPDDGPHPSTRWLQRHFPAASMLLAATALAGSALGMARGDAPAAALFFALSLAALLLAALDRRHRQLPALPLRVAADAALLTPLLVLPILR